MSGYEVIDFIEGICTHTKDVWAGQSFILEDWQKVHLLELFGTLDSDGIRRYRTSYWELPKKNGKSELAAGVALYGLLGDGVKGAEVYIAAAKRDQAGKIFKVCEQMVRNNPKLLKECKIISSTKTIVSRKDKSSFLTAISADAGFEDGMNPSLAIFDELHRQKTRDLWDVLKRSGATRLQPLLLAITTAGVKSESPICWEQHEYARKVQEGVYKDPSYYPVLYSLGEDEDWTDEENWRKVNPALGDIRKEKGKFKDIRSVRSDFRQAIKSPSSENAFRRFELNQWLSAESRWISLNVWDQAELFNADDLVGKKCTAGLDLSSVSDLTALVLDFNVDGEYFLLPFFWMPEETVKELSGDVPYNRWVKQGLIEQTPGSVVDYRAIRKKLNDVREIYQLSRIVIDPWNAAQITNELKEDGFEVIDLYQRISNLNAPSKFLEKLIKEGKLRHNGHPILRWNMDCCEIYQNADGYIKPVKPDRGSSNKRIDGISATVNSLDPWLREEIQKPSIYETQGIEAV